MKDNLPRKFTPPPEDSIAGTNPAPAVSGKQNAPVNNNKQSSNNLKNNKKNNKDNKKKNNNNNNNNQIISAANSTDNKGSSVAAEKDTSLPKDWQEEKATFEEQEEEVLAIMRAEMGRMFGKLDPHELNESFLNQHSGAITHRLQGKFRIFFH